MEGNVVLDSSCEALEALGSSEKDRQVVVVVGRAEIDTSAPFESVKEAVDRFGGSAVWKSQLKQLFHPPEKHHCSEDVDIMEVEEQASQLEKDLILKERETLDVLKELERTKKIVDDLKLRLQKESSEFTELTTVDSGHIKVQHPIPDAEEHNSEDLEKLVVIEGPCKGANQPPGLILNELKQAKVYLNKTTTDLAEIRNSIELLNSKIEKEKLLLEQTREKLNSNTALASSLEEDLYQTATKLKMAKDLESKRCKDPSSILEEIKETNTLIEQYRKIAESAKDEVNKLTSDIEQTKASIKTAEIRLVAAKKMEEATRAAEAIALAEIKALTSSNNSALNSDNSGVKLSMEEYAILTRKAQEADEMSRKKIETAMLQVDEANRSKSELLTKVEKATEEVKVFTKSLEDALKRVEVANRGKLAVEDALRKWRAEHGQKRRNIQNSKFKNHAAHHRKGSHMLDLNGSTLVADLPNSGFRPPLSIGQILSMKLLGPESEEYEVGVCEKENEKPPKVSLGQMLNKKQGVSSPQSQKTEDGSARQYSGKRKKLGFVRFPLLLAKQNKKNKKRPSLTTR